MAKGRKTGGRNFLPGVVTNPNGRRKTPDDVKFARKMTKDSVDLLLNKFMFMEFQKIKEFYLTSSGLGAEQYVASIFIHGIKKGCPYRLDFLFNRLIGKVKDQVDHNMPIPMIIKRIDGTEVLLTSEVREPDQNE